MRRVLRLGLREFEILVRHDFHPDDDYIKFVDESSALSFLRKFASECDQERILRDWLADAQFSPDLGRLRSEELLRQLAGQIMTGAVRITRSGVPSPVGGGSVSAPPIEEEEEASEETPVVPPKPAEPLKWIEVLVVDDATKKGRGDTTLKIKLGDKNPQNFPAKKTGMVRIDHLASGTTCDVQEVIASELLEVIDLS